MLRGILVLFWAVLFDGSLGGTFLQLTDLHWDPDYEANCEGGGPYGRYGCDSPWRLVSTALDEAKRLAPNPDAILWTGDSMPHIPDANYTAQGPPIRPASSS